MLEDQLLGSYKEIIVEEYKALQEEHRKNREYLFEKPLLIVTILATIAQYIFIFKIDDTGPNNVTPLLKLLTFLFLIYMLKYNLAFSRDKLRSDARIVAYTHYFFERKDIEWIGWETSLMYNRVWSNKTKNMKEPTKSYFNEQNVNVPKKWFYWKIYMFHIYAIILLLGVSIIVAFSLLSFNRFMFISAIALILIILYWLYQIYESTSPLHPSKNEMLIEEERAKWEATYKEVIVPEYINKKTGFRCKKS